MLRRSSIGSVAIAVALGAAMAGARAHDEAKYPDWKGQWVRMGGIQWDPSKPLGRAELAPLTPEYQAIFEAGLASQAAGGQGNDPTYTCIPPGMPRAMTVVYPMEIVVMPETTYIMIEYANQLRRIYTDGRDWPEALEPSFAGYSIGKWEDEDQDGRYDALLIETRGMKGPRTFDASGIPLHKDNQTIVKERIYLDKANPNILHAEVTTTDNALTRPWTVIKNYRRERKPIWFEYVCAEGNHHVAIGKENYYISQDGYLMPTRKNQPAPDLKYFNQARQ
ncbi:MAG TPA: hypothetical protein VKE26_18910 [Xanthobacteraceae bacterium]|nr:hypothetical protein [Xanthobacteraceae bacterium]